MMDKESYGIASTGASSEVADRDLGDRRGDGSKDLVKYPHTALTIIFAVGVVAGLMEFIYLSFLHPDVSNVVIPLIMQPLIQFLWERYRESKEAKKRELQSIETR